MGRPPKLVGEQTGHLTQQQIQEKQEAEAAISIGFSYAKKPPKKLLVDSVAVKEYKRIVKLIEELEILVICDMDIANICGYCNAYSMYFKATAELRTQELTIKKAQGLAPNPLIEVQHRYASEMRRFGALIGADVSSRLKLSMAKVKTNSDDISDLFGDI